MPSFRPILLLRTDVLRGLGIAGAGPVSIELELPTPTTTAGALSITLFSAQAGSLTMDLFGESTTETANAQAIPHNSRKKNDGQ